MSVDEMVRRRKTVMVVDDDSVLLELLVKALQISGFDPAGFTDPSKAVDYYRSSWEEVDVVILDLLMGPVNGLDVLHALLKCNTNAKVVLMSGYWADGGVPPNIRHHIAAFLPKPFGIEDLKRVIERLAVQEDSASQDD